jgi:zinc/manganese transport system permease protein
MEKFHELMAADILFTPLHDVVKTAVFYSLLGIIIYHSMKRTKGFTRDLLFFVTFAITVTSSVKLAGVLVIFAILISPALIATIFKARRPVIFAWTVGLIINFISILFSHIMDLPTGYTLVFFHAAITIIICMVKPIFKK